MAGLFLCADQMFYTVQREYALQLYEKPLMGRYDLHLAFRV